MDLRARLEKDFDNYELYTIKNSYAAFDIRNGALRDSSFSGLEGKNLRVRQNGKSGSNFTMGSSPGGVEALLEGARLSAGYGPDAAFDFSGDKLRRRAESAAVPAEALLEYSRGFLSFIREKSPSLPVNIHCGCKAGDLSIITGSGGSCAEEQRAYYLNFSAPVPGGSSEVSKTKFSRFFFDGYPEDEAEEFIREYEIAGEVSRPPSGRMPVLFSPEALFFFVFCLQEGVSARNLYLKISPLAKKQGERIFSGAIALRDEPGKPDSPHSRAFDDEGVKTAPADIVRDGVLENFICDLNYGARLGKPSTGSGMKSSLFSEGPGTPVSPAFVNPVILPGRCKRDDMLGELKRGIIVKNVLGFHSSNYTQGHFSVQAHGFHVKNGTARGRLEDVMLAGNIYEDFMKASAGDTLYCTSYGHAPWMLVEDLSVSGE